MTVLRQIQIEVPSDLNILDRLLLEFNRIYQDFISDRDWLQCRLALVEGFTNAVRHAHKNFPPEVPVKIEAILTAKRIEIRIWDLGAPFDLNRLIRNIVQDEASWRNKARGVTILMKIADRLDYYRTPEEKNCLLIVKKLTSVRNEV